MQSTNNSATQIPITRDLVTYVSGTSGTATVSGLLLGLPTGARIMKMKVKLLNGRRLQASFFPAQLIATVDGTTSGITRVDVAPYNRFPVITCNVPDVAAKVIPNDATNICSLTGATLNSGTVAEFEITTTCTWQANIYA